MPASLLDPELETRPMESDAGPARSPWVKPAVVGASIGAATLGLRLIGPTDSGFAVCWSQRFFGIDCPLCGGLRCVGALAQGDFLAAADHNVIAAVALPLLTIAWVVWMVSAIARKPVAVPKVPNWLIGALAVLVAAFTITRNLGGPAWVDWLASTSYR